MQVDLLGCELGYLFTLWHLIHTIEFTYGCKRHMLLV